MANSVKAAQVLRDLHSTNGMNSRHALPAYRFKPANTEVFCAETKLAILFNSKVSVL